MLQTVYLVLCAIDIVIPHSQFVPFLMLGGNVQQFIEQLFANDIASVAALALISSSIALSISVYIEGFRLQIKNLWIDVAADLTVGISLALPLFLLMRQRQLN
ncbi:MAG: hypothetical protein Kow00121_36810 [Elainellaceae cyanobacterium]